jgi:hypothetical protein
MEFVHGSAWSEPQFLVFALTSLAVAVHYVATGRQLALVGAGALVSGAVMTRYAGLSLVPTVALALLWCRKPVRAVVLFVCVACLPLALWIAHNALSGGLLVGDRGIAWRDLASQPLGKGLFTAVDWLLPTRFGALLVNADGDVRGTGIVVFVVVGAAIAWWMWKNRTWLCTRAVDSEADLLQRMLLVFSVMYIGGVLISMVAFDPLVQLDTRILAPVFVCLVILLSARAPRAFGRAWQITWLRAPVSLVAAGLATAYALRFAALVATVHAQGVIYSNTEWLASATMQRVRQLPTDAIVFSNAPDAVYILARRSSNEIPDVGHADTFSGVLQQATQTASGPVVLAYFGDPNIAYRDPVPATLIKGWLPTRLVANFPDGELYDVQPASGPGTS